MLIRVSEVEKYPEKIPFKSSTLYMWAHLGKYEEIFVKLDRSLFVDTEKFKLLVEQNRGIQRRGKQKLSNEIQ